MEVSNGFYSYYYRGLFFFDTGFVFGEVVELEASCESTLEYNKEADQVEKPQEGIIMVDEYESDEQRKKSNFFLNDKKSIRVDFEHELFGEKYKNQEKSVMQKRLPNSRMVLSNKLMKSLILRG